MSCPAPELLAAAASGEAEAVLSHASECLACRRILDEQRQLRAVVVSTPPVVLSRERRAELAAEVLAHADAPPVQRRPYLAAAFGIAAAAAVVIVAIGALDRGPAPAAPTLAVPAFEPTGQRSHAVAVESAVAPIADPREPQARVAGASADFARSLVRGRDTVVLRDGELEIDSRSARAVDISSGKTGVRVAGKVTVVARGGVIQTVTVFAGSAEVTREGRRHLIEAGAVWEPEVRHSPSLDAFRVGWEALRAGDNRGAIAAFDRATDPVVHEDAAYWAAVAAERAGDRDDARRRLSEFLALFPTSPRVETARSALDRLR